MKNLKLNKIVFLALIFFMSFVACESFKKNYEQSFKKSFLPSFTSSCASSATKSGVPNDFAQQTCACMGEYLISHLSSTELTKLSIQNNTSPELQKVMDDSIASCKVKK